MTRCCAALPAASLSAVWDLANIILDLLKMKYHKSLFSLSQRHADVPQIHLRESQGQTPVQADEQLISIALFRCTTFLQHERGFANLTSNIYFRGQQQKMSCGLSRLHHNARSECNPRLGKSGSNRNNLDQPLFM